MDTLEAGGRNAVDEERVYLKDAEFYLPSGQRMRVKRSNIRTADMPALFARHLGRYYQAMVFCRPDQRVLDFPCGSGYASELFVSVGANYTGLDLDEVATAYANAVYGGPGVRFARGDLTAPDLPPGSYDLIGCNEGLEHIELRHQDRLIAALHAALKKGGTLVVSSPENPDGRSGQSSHNPWHRGELTREDFLALLRRHFPPSQIEMVTCRAALSSGVTTNMFLGICHNA